MRQIINSYGNTILITIVVLLVLTTLYGNFYTIPGTGEKGNFFDVMNSSVDSVDTVLDDAKVDEKTTTKLEELHENKAPSLAVKMDTCYKGVEYDASDFIKSDDGCILVITEIDYLGKPMDDTYESDGSSVSFNAAGTYRLQITSASKTTNLKTIKDLEVTVQRKM